MDSDQTPPTNTQPSIEEDSVPPVSATTQDNSVNNNNNINNNNNRDNSNVSTANTNNDGLTLSLSFTMEVPEISHKQSGDFLLLSSVKAPLYQPDKRAAADIVAVIDKSGSMAGQKQDLVKTMLSDMVNTLSPVDQLSIITYQDNVTTDLPLCFLTEEGKNTARAAINSITSGGCTNLSGGLVQGVKELAHRTHKNDVASVLLFTDGLINVGPSAPPQILQAVRDAARMKKENENEPLPGTINTFGFGSDHDASMLRILAEKGGGVYYYIENATRISESFADCFGGLLSTFAQNMTLSFEAGTGVQIKKIQSKYIVTTIVPNAHYSVHIGDIQSEENRDIITLVELPSLDQEEPAFPVVKITLSYYNTLTSTTEFKTAIAVVARPAVVTPGLKRDLYLDKQNNRIIASAALEQAAEAGAKNNFPQANTILTDAISRIKESVSAADQFCVSLVADLEKCKEGLKDRASYTSVGQQTLSNNYMAHTYQRSTNQGWSSQKAYQTSSRSSVSSKWH